MVDKAQSENVVASAASSQGIRSSFGLPNSDVQVTYRVEEILRVLGDPRDHAEIKSSIGSSLTGWMS